jgi:hypothetical protein
VNAVEPTSATWGVAQQIALGGAMIALPIHLQMVLEYNALQAAVSLWHCSPGRKPETGARAASSDWDSRCSLWEWWY